MAEGVTRKRPDEIKVSKGRCLILNKRGQQRGDANALKAVFQNLNFHVSIVECMSVPEVQDSVNKMAEQEKVNEEKNNAIIVIVLSDKSYDSMQDGIYYYMVKPLSNENCKHLKHRPKMFFIFTYQHVKGKAKVAVADSPMSEKDDFFQKRNFSMLPETSDVLISVIEQGISVGQNLDKVTPYVDYLAKVLNKFSGDMDLLSMLFLAERNLQNAEVKKMYGSEINVSTSIKFVGWSKKVYFTLSNQSSESLTVQFLPVVEIYDPKGVCLIINNVDYDEGPRKGSEFDKVKVQKFFEQRGFQVMVKDNLLYQDTLNVLQHMASQKELNKKCSALVIVALSHGNKDGIYSTDSKVITIDQLWSPFKDSNCPELKGKPKMFFIQACKGNETPVGLPDGRKNADIGIWESPEISDVLISYSAQPGFEAMRLEETGTPYVNHLVKLLDLYRLPVIDILLMLENEMRDTDMTNRKNDILCLSTSVELRGWSQKVFFKSEIQDVPDSTQNKFLLVLGGSKGPVRLSDDGQQWIQMESTSSERSDLVSRAYDRQSNQWIKLPDMPKTKSIRPTVLCQEMVYASTDEKPPTLVGLKVFDPRKKTWSRLPVKMEIPRYGYAIAACENYVWVFGGRNGTTYLRDVERFCPRTATWKTRSPMPTARTDFSVTYFKGKFYAIGGIGTSGQILDVVEIYNPNNNEWEIPGPPLPSATAGHIATVIKK